VTYSLGTATGDGEAADDDDDDDDDAPSGATAAARRPRTLFRARWGANEGVATRASARVGVAMDASWSARASM
jgi:hypothetical protein